MNIGMHKLLMLESKTLIHHAHGPEINPRCWLGSNFPITSRCAGKYFATQRAHALQLEETYQDFFVVNCTIYSTSLFEFTVILACQPFLGKTCEAMLIVPICLPRNIMISDIDLKNEYPAEKFMPSQIRLWTENDMLDSLIY